MKPSEILKSVSYAVLFGLLGLIIGIWMADLLYSLILKNIARLTTTYISLVIIILITASAFLLGFTRGKTLLE
jgi:uncharacterized protein YacL